jgi:hypothetical protein
MEPPLGWLLLPHSTDREDRDAVLLHQPADRLLIRVGMMDRNLYTWARRWAGERRRSARHRETERVSPITSFVDPKSALTLAYF